MNETTAGRTRTLGRALPALLVSLVVAACSSGSGAGSTQANAGATTGAGVTAAAATSGVDALPTGQSADSGQYACARVSKADAQALFSQDLGQLQISGQVSSDNCEYKAPNGDDLLQVETTDGSLYPNEYADDIKSLGLNTPISGIGDAAMYELIIGVFPELVARKGNSTCLLSIGHDMTVLNVPLATPALDMSPIQPSAVADFMQKFGNLCNEVFG